jgi:Protein of unknwon function (DUF3310)
MGTEELSATRVRNQKRRQSRKRRAELARSNEHGGAMVKTVVTKQMTEKDIMKVWVDEYDVGAPNAGGYTDAKWRAECEQRSRNLKAKTKEVIERDTTRANKRQVGGDHYKNMGVEVWDVVDTWPIEQRIGAYRIGLLKYTMRMGSKDENVQEIQKAEHYAQKLIEVLKERDRGDA